MNTAGISVRLSTYPVNEIIDRLQALLRRQGATIYVRIDQQAELQKVGLRIPPLEFILFGNPSAGGKLLLANPLIALDLPLKLIAWEDEHQQVWLGYNDAAYLENRYSLKSDTNSPLALDGLITEALAQNK